MTTIIMTPENIEMKVLCGGCKGELETIVKADDVDNKVDNVYVRPCSNCLGASWLKGLQDNKMHNQTPFMPPS